MILPSEELDRILSSSFWIPSLETMSTYSITHDDNEGNYNEKILILITPDGDVRIDTTAPLRFRFPGLGGGEYPKIRNALLILAEAIRQETTKDIK
mgnify:CR=1 FL=1